MYQNPDFNLERKRTKTFNINDAKFAKNIHGHSCRNRSCRAKLASCKTNEESIQEQKQHSPL